MADFRKKEDAVPLANGKYNLDRGDKEGPSV